MGGGKGKSPKAPKPIDPGKAQGEYMFGRGFSNYQGVTDPRLQQRILDAEARFRPQYSALELADINTMWEGIEDPKKSPAYQTLQAELAGLEAGAAVSDLSSSAKRAALGKQFDASRAGLSSGGEKNRRRRSGMGRGGFGGNYRSERKRKEKISKNREEYIEAGMSSATDRAARTATVKAQMGQLEQTKGVKGYKSLLADASRQSGMLEREMLGLQRADDVSALQEFAPQVVEAYRDADPYSTGLADQQTAMADDLYQRSQGLNQEQQRTVDQQALQMSQASGRIGDESSAAGQILGREGYLSSLRGEAAGMGQQAFGMNRQLAGDIGSTILGRPSSAIGLGQSGIGQATNLAAGPMGPQLFDPNVGINMAMQNQQNQMNASIAGAANKTAAYGATVGAMGSALGGICWVAREVYGEHNPKWKQFRDWLTSDAPKWFNNLYTKYGERFAKFISDKPRIKSIIRKWMDTKIK